MPRIVPWCILLSIIALLYTARCLITQCPSPIAYRPSSIAGSKGLQYDYPKGDGRWYSKVYSMRGGSFCILLVFTSFSIVVYQCSIAKQFRKEISFTRKDFSQVHNVVKRRILVILQWFFKSLQSRVEKMFFVLKNLLRNSLPQADREISLWLEIWK